MEQSVLAKIAKLDLLRVSEKQIGLCMGVTEGRISQIKATEDYQKIYADLQAADFEKLDLMNRGWDGIEEQAMANVLAHLHQMPDADFSLRAAALANRAQRRGNHGISPLIVRPDMQAVIQLNVAFVQQVGQQLEVKPREFANLQKKATNFLSVKGVQNLLGSESPLNIKSDINDIFAMAEPT